MSSELRELYQEVILDHSKRPRNLREIAGGRKADGVNPLCGDKATIYLAPQSHAGRLREAKPGAGGTDMGKLAVFSGVCEFPVRVKCASLPWHTMKAALAGEGEKVSTE